MTAKSPTESTIETVASFRVRYVASLQGLCCPLCSETKARYQASETVQPQNVEGLISVMKCLVPYTRICPFPMQCCCMVKPNGCAPELCMF